MELTYSKEVAEVITQKFLKDYLEYRENGVFIQEGCIDNDPTGLFTWTPSCELEGPNAPDALTAPALPIPFNARELGAFFLHGVGAHIVGCFGGSYESGPDELMLQDLGIRAGKAREALRAAYTSILNAQKAVGMLDDENQNRAADLFKQYADDRDAAIVREKVMERMIVGKHKDGSPEFGDFIPNEEYLLRLVRAQESLSSLKQQAKQAKAKADAEFGTWLKGMVRHLLQPQSAISESFVVSDSTRRLALLRQLGGSSKFINSEWRFKGIALLVKSEKNESRKRSDQKTIRADLKEAAQSELDAKRAGVFNGLGQR